MNKTNDFYSKFTTEEIKFIEDSNAIFNYHHGMSDALIMAEKMLGKTHKFTCALRKKLNDSLSSIEPYPPSLSDKLLNMIVEKKEENE